MRALIVDDEALARTTLKAFIEDYCPELTIVGEASNVPEAIKLIGKLNPALIFLDIEMPKISGLELPSFFEDDELDFQIIFTTAYSQYAVEAFRLSAVDYLLKPIEIEQLQEAVQRAIEHKTPATQQKNIKALQENLNDNHLQRLVVPTADGFEFIEIKDIESLQAEGSYTKIKLSNKKTLIVSRNLKEFQKLEQYGHFFKCHRSHIVNLSAIKQFVRTDGGYIVMNTGDNIPISKRRKNEFLELIEQLF